MEVRPRPCCYGFSLLEVVLVMALSTLIVGGMVLALQSQERAYRAQRSGREELENLDFAVRQLQQDLQLMGAGLPPQTLAAIAPGPGNGRPILTVRYLTEAPFVTRLAAPGSSQSKLFRIPSQDTRHFRKGDQVLVHNDGAWLTFRVEAVESRSSSGLRPASDISGSAEGEPFRLTFPQGSKVVLLRNGEVQYIFGRGEAWDGRLVRRQGTQEAVVAVGVQEFNIQYLVASPDEAGPRWTPTPGEDTFVLGTRVQLVIGKTAVRFTVMRRNLSPGSIS